MKTAITKADWNDSVTEHMRRDFSQLAATQTVGEALESLRRNPPSGRIIYFYVVDEDGRLRGVVPTRRLLLSPLRQPLSEIMVKQVVTLPASATCSKRANSSSSTGSWHFPSSMTRAA